MENNKWIDSELFNFITDYYERYGDMPKVFISGAISDRLDTYKEHFDEAEKRFKEIWVEVYNPAKIDINTPWKEAMKETLAQMETCEFMYVLKNWENSKGVKIEIEQAKKSKMPIFYE